MRTQLNGSAEPEKSTVEKPRPTEFCAVVKHSSALVTSVIPASWQVCPVDKSV